MVIVTVREVWHSVLPAETRVVAGEAGLDRPVAWAASLRSRPPIFPSLQGDDLALLSLAALRRVGADLDLEAIVNRLAERAVAAIAVAGAVSTGAALAAETSGTPLLVLPADANLHELESEVVRFVSQRRTELYQWGLEAQHRLTGISMAGLGVAGMVKGLAEFTGRTVALLDPDLRVRHFSSAGDSTPPEGLDQGLVEAAPALAELRRATTPASMESADSDLPARRIQVGDSAAWVTSVEVGTYHVGYLAILGPGAHLGERERLAVQRGAVACALELAKERAVAEAETRLRGDFVDEILEGRFGDNQAVVGRALHQGYDLTQPYLALVLEPDVPASFGHLGHLLDELGLAVAQSQSDGKLIVRSRGGRLVVLCPLAGELDTERSTKMVQTAIGKVGARWPGVVVSIGIGRYHPSLEGLCTSHREAEQALSIGRDLFGPGSLTSFKDLGAYRLLFLLHRSPELRNFYRETLGELVDYDAKNRTELVHTLEVYFACQGNLQNTAEALYLHRNSLAYRMRRIQDLTSLNLDDQEDRFQLQLALKIRRILSP